MGDSCGLLTGFAETCLKRGIADAMADLASAMSLSGILGFESMSRFGRPSESSRQNGALTVCSRGYVQQPPLCKISRASLTSICRASILAKNTQLVWKRL